MFRPRRLQVQTQVETINLVIKNLSIIKRYVSIGVLVLTIEEMEELEASLRGSEILIDLVEWSNFRLGDPPSPAR